MQTGTTTKLYCADKRGIWHTRAPTFAPFLYLFKATITQSPMILHGFGEAAAVAMGPDTPTSTSTKLAADAPSDGNGAEELSGTDRRRRYEGFRHVTLEDKVEESTFRPRRLDQSGRRERHPLQLSLGREPDVGGEPQGLERTHDPPGHVELPPLESVARRVLEGVVVVVPTFSEC